MRNNCCRAGSRWVASRPLTWTPSAFAFALTAARIRSRLGLSDCQCVRFHRTPLQRRRVVGRDGVGAIANPLNHSAHAVLRAEARNAQILALEEGMVVALFRSNPRSTGSGSSRMANGRGPPVMVPTR